jgi:hypothetical protein
MKNLKVGELLCHFTYTDYEIRNHCGEPIFEDYIEEEYKGCPYDNLNIVECYNEVYSKLIIKV